MDQLIKRENIDFNTFDLGLGGGSLLQVANRTPIQMMSYIIDCPNGGVIVIDGGNALKDEAEHLYSLLEKRGRHVDYWFFTHAHRDHYGALVYLIENDMLDIKIGKLVYDFPSLEWLETVDSDCAPRFFAAMEKASINTVTPKAGEVFECGGIFVEIISGLLDYKDFPNINPTSIIFKVHFPKRDVLFLGDFDKNGEDSFKKTYDVNKLRCDIVQMPHHGQNGITRSFYELIMPKYCLYTAPDWLWENNLYGINDPETKGKGPFTTLETRRWMEELGAKESFHLGQGDWLFT